MLFIWFKRTYPDELRADFQEYYNLSLDDIGNKYSWHHAICLANELPRTSRTLRATNPANEIGLQDTLLASCEYNLRNLVWIQTKDATRGKNRPKPIDLTQIYKTKDHRQERSKSGVTISQLREIL